MPKIKKIALILPRGKIYKYKTGAFGKYIRYAPLTMQTLAALIPPEMNIDVTVYDEGVETFRKENIKADLVGVTAITGTSTRAYLYADYFRSIGVPVVIGGVHATLLPEEAMQHADAIATGIATENWPMLLRDFETGNMKRRYDQSNNVNFAGWPAPKRQVYDDKKIRFITINSVQATYGCTNRCEFCVTPYSCKGYHHRPIPEVIEEIKLIKNKHILFVDPSPIEDRRYAIDLFKALIPLKKKWVGCSTLRIAFDDELLDMAAKSGCKGLLIGFESVTDEVLLKIHKDFNDPGKFYLASKKLHAKGISIMACFVFGLDGDDKNVFKRTVDFINKADIDLPRFTVATPFPSTLYYKKMENAGRIIERNWELYDCQHVVIQPKLMSPEELQEGERWAWREVYKPSSIAHRLSGSKCFLGVSLLSNFTYRTYAYNLPRFTKKEMLDNSDI